MAIFRCGACGREAPGRYFGEYRWSLPDGWLCCVRDGVQVATCGTRCQAVISAKYQETDLTVPISVSMPASKEILLNQGVVPVPRTEEDAETKPAKVGSDVNGKDPSTEFD